jgi:hypothetical protein
MIRMGRLYNIIIEQEWFKPGSALAAATKTGNFDAI